VPASGPISVWCQHGNFSKLAHLLYEREQAWRIYAIIIGYENMFLHMIEFFHHFLLPVSKLTKTRDKSAGQVSEGCQYRRVT
jgi:hypothetical protein